MPTFEIPAVKCLHGVEVNWSRYRDTIVTDPALVACVVKLDMLLLYIKNHNLTLSLLKEHYSMGM